MDALTILIAIVVPLALIWMVMKPSRKWWDADDNDHNGGSDWW